MFEKGHPYFPPKGGPPTGFTRDQRIAKRNLAMVLRDTVTEEEIARVLRAIAIDGKDPSAPEGTAFIPPTIPERLAALKMLLERRNGNAVDSEKLEAEIKHALEDMRGSNKPDLTLLSEEELEQYRQLQRKAIERGRALTAGNK